MIVVYVISMSFEESLEDLANKSPYNNLNKRRLDALKSGNDAKYAFLTDFLGFQVEGDHHYEFGKQLLEESPERFEQLEHEVNFVIYGKEYSNYLSEKIASEERLYYEHRAKEFYNNGKYVSSNPYDAREEKINLLKKYFPERFGKNGSAFKKKGNKCCLEAYNDVGVEKTFRSVLNKIKKDYGLR